MKKLTLFLVVLLLVNISLFSQGSIGVDCLQFDSNFVGVIKSDSIDVKDISIVGLYAEVKDDHAIIYSDNPFEDNSLVYIRVDRNFLFSDAIANPMLGSEGVIKRVRLIARDFKNTYAALINQRYGKKVKRPEDIDCMLDTFVGRYYRAMTGQPIDLPIWRSTKDGNPVKIVIDDHETRQRFGRVYHKGLVWPPKKRF